MRIQDLSGTGGKITQGVARIGCKVRRYFYREGTLPLRPGELRLRLARRQVAIRWGAAAFTNRRR